MPIAASADDGWTIAASSDMTSSSWTREKDGWSTLHYTNSPVTVTSEGGSALNWYSTQYYNDGDLDNGNMGNGYLHLKENTTPITGADAFKIDVQFKFTGDFEITNAGGDTTGSAIFMNITNIANCDWFNNDTKSNYMFMHNGNGNVSLNSNASTYTTTSGAAYQIDTKNPYIDKNTYYHYVLTYKNNIFHVVITDNSLNTIIDYGTYKLDNFDTNNIKDIVIGMSNGRTADFSYQNINYKDIKFYTGSNDEESEPAPEAKDRYLFAYFTGNNDATTTTEYNQSIRFGVSADGQTFTKLNGGNTVVTQTKGTRNARDPYIFEGQDGYYYMIATDMDCKTGWWGNSNSMVLWRSKDLLHWKDETIINMDDIIGRGAVVARCWAPQVIWDENENKYMIYFALGTTDDYTANTDMVYCYTNNLLDQNSYTKPQLLYHSPANKDSIDGDITCVDGKYYMFYKDESVSTICVISSDNLTSGFDESEIITLNTYFNDGKSEGLEGCQIYKEADGDYIFFADRFGANGVFAAFNFGKDLASALELIKNGKSVMDYYDSSLSAQFTAFNPRHGSMINITKSQYNALKSGKFSQEALARYFVGSNLTQDYMSGRYPLTNGTNSSASWDSSEYNNNGAAGFVCHTQTANNANGSSYLYTTQIDEMLNNALVSSSNGITVSFYAKPNESGLDYEWQGRFFEINKNESFSSHSWAGDADTAAYFEMYKNGTFEVTPRRGGGFKSTANFGTDYYDSWHLYTVTIKSGLANIYVDGVKKTSIKDNNSFISNTFSSVLNDGQLIIGGCLWNGDKSYQGNIRDFRIFKGTMNINTVLDLYNTDIEVEAAQTVISNYESMMSAGVVYTNMLPAYEAYINLCEVRDAVKYGKDTTADLESATVALSNAIDDMEIFTGFAGNNPNAADGSYSSDNLYSFSHNNVTYTDEMKNVLYTYGVSGNAPYNADSSVKKCYVGFQYGAIVFLYDGSEMACPINAYIHRNGDGKRRCRSITPITEGFSLKGLWRGNQTSNSTTYQTYTGVVSNVDGDTSNASLDMGENNYYYTNTLYLNASLDSSTYSASYTPTFCFRDNEGNYGTNTTGGAVSQGDQTIYAVNYKVLIDTVNSNKSKLVAVQNYKEGGLKQIYATFDCATSFDPNTLFGNIGTDTSKVSAAVSDAAAKIKKLCTSITGLSAPVTDNSSAPTQSDYAAMRSYLDESRTISDNTFTVLEAYNDGFNNGFKEGRYATFKAAYEAARDMMATLDDADNTGYAYHSNVTTLANSLHDAFLALEYAVTVAPSVEGNEYLGISDAIKFTNNDADSASKVYYRYKYNGDSFSEPVLTSAAFNGGKDTFVPFAGVNKNKKSIVIRAYCVNADGTKYTADATFYNLSAPSITQDDLLYADDDGTVTIQSTNNGGGQLQYKIDDGQWVNTNGAIKPFELTGYTDELELTVYAREIKNYSGTVSTSDVVSCTYIKAEEFSIYSVTGAEQSTTSYTNDSTEFVINDAAKYSSKDRIIYYLYIDGELDGGIIPVDYNSPIAITSEMRAASCVRIRAFLKTNEAIYTYADQTLVNSSNYDSFIYQESFGGSVSGTTYTTNSKRGYNATLTAENTARIDAVKGPFDGNGNSGDLRKNVLYIKGGNCPGNKVTVNNNPLSDNASRAVSKIQGITVSFWRQLYTTGDNPSVTDFNTGSHNDEGALVFEDKTDSGHRNRYFRIDLDGDLSFVLGNGSNFVDYKTAVSDNTGHDTPSTRGNWVNFVLTVNPNGEMFVYVNGVPHALSYGNKAGALEIAANSNDKAYIAQQIIDFFTDKNTVITYSNGVGWRNMDYDLAIDDVRIYTEVKTQTDVQNMYGDANSDKPSGVASTHDPTNVTVYTLAKDVTYSYKGTSHTVSAGNEVGQELIDFVNIDVNDSNDIDVTKSTDVSRISYYSFGTGMTVYRSDDAVNWTVVGDSDGRCGYQNRELFITNDNQPADYTEVLSEPLNYVCNNEPNTSTGAGYLMWAPHVMYNISENAWMYYCSTSTWGGKQSAIFVAKSKNSIEKNYKYLGLIMKSENNPEGSSNDNPNAIDPCVFYESSYENLYIVLGSWGWNTNNSCVNYKALNADGTASSSSGSSTTPLVKGMINGEGQGGSNNSGEGAFVIKNKDGNSYYYYLYVTYGQNNGNYTQRVFRSRNPVSDYAGINGKGSLDTSEGTIHGNSILAPYYVSANEHIYTSVGHNSAYIVKNKYGQMITVNAAHSRPFTSRLTGYTPIDEKALATRQSDLNGNISLQNMIAYTSNGWPVAFPMPYNGTDTTMYKGVNTKADGSYKFTAYDLEGIYSGNMQMTYADYDYAGRAGATMFNVVPTDNESGVMINTSTDAGYSFELTYGDLDGDGKDDITYIDLFNSKTNDEIGYGVIANQGEGNSAKTEFSIVLTTGQHMWGVWNKEYPHDAESAGDMVEIDSVVYTHKAGDSYAMYGQEISDDINYITSSANGERVTTIKVKYPYYIDTNDQTSVICLNDPGFVRQGYSGGAYRAELIGFRSEFGNPIYESDYSEGCYAYYKLTGTVSDYFSYRSGKYPESGLELLITYTDGNTSYGEYEFPFVMPNPAIAHTIQGIRNQNSAVNSNKKTGQLLFDRFIGSSGTSSGIISGVTKENNTSDGKSSTGDPKLFGTGIFNYVDNWGNSESLEQSYNSPSAMADKFRFLSSSDGVNSGSYGMIEHSNASELSYTVSSNVVDADYYIDYSDTSNYTINNPRGIITSTTKNGKTVPTGYTFDFRTSNIKWVGSDEQKSRYGTTSYVLTTGDAKSKLDMDSTYDGHKDSFVIGKEDSGDGTTWYTFGNYYSSSTARPANYPSTIFSVGDNAYNERDGVLNNIYVNSEYGYADCRNWNEFLLGGAMDFDNKYSLGLNDEVGRKVMSGYLSDPNSYIGAISGANAGNIREFSDYYTLGLTRALPLVNAGHTDTNAWNMHITFTGDESIHKNTDTSSAEKYANFILEQGIITRTTNTTGNHIALAEEAYAYYNIGVNTCDKGAVREFVNTWANKEMNISTTSDGRVSSIAPKTVDGSTDIKSGNYSVNSYNDYLDAVAEAFWFVNNPKNTTYVNTDDHNDYEYSTAYGETPDGQHHALIYDDEDGNSIFGTSAKLPNSYSESASARTDRVQAGIIKKVIDAYNNLYNITEYTNDSDIYGRIEISTEDEENDTIKIYVDSSKTGDPVKTYSKSGFTSDSWNSFVKFIGDISPYYAYTTDPSQKSNTTEYWRYVTLTAPEYRELVSIVESADNALMPKVDTSSLQPLTSNKRKKVSGGIFAEDDVTVGGRTFEAGSQIYTYPSWSTLNTATENAENALSDVGSTSTYTASDGTRKTFEDGMYKVSAVQKHSFDGKPYYAQVFDRLNGNVTQSSYNANTNGEKSLVSDVQKAVYDNYNTLNPLDLALVDTNEAYQTFDSANAVLYAINTDKYTAEGVSRINAAKEQYKNVYNKIDAADADAVTAYNSLTNGTDIVTNDIIKLTGVNETQQYITELLSVITDVDTNFVRKFVATMTVSVNGNTAGVEQPESVVSEYGETVSFDISESIGEGDAVVYGVSYYDDAAANINAKTIDTENFNPTGSVKSKIVNNELKFVADQNLAITADITKASEGDFTSEVRIYNGFNQLQQLAYVGDISSEFENGGTYIGETVDGKANTLVIDTVTATPKSIPFYTFRYWKVSINGNVYTFKPVYDVTGEVNLTVKGGSTEATAHLPYDKKIYITLDSEYNNENFVAWTAKKGSKYQIVSYNTTFSTYTIKDEFFEPMIKVNGKYKLPVSNIELTYEDFDFVPLIDSAPVSTTESGLTDESVFENKLDGKYPFVSVITVKHGTNDGKYFSRSYLRITSGADVTQSNAGSIIRYNGRLLTYNASSVTETNQAVVTVNSSKSELGAVTHKGFIDYTYSAGDTSFNLRDTTAEYSSEA